MRYCNVHTVSVRLVVYYLAHISGDETQMSPLDLSTLTENKPIRCSISFLQTRINKKLGTQ